MVTVESIISVGFIYSGLFLKYCSCCTFSSQWGFYFCGNKSWSQNYTNGITYDTNCGFITL